MHLQPFHTNDICDLDISQLCFFNIYILLIDCDQVLNWIRRIILGNTLNTLLIIYVSYFVAIRAMLKLVLYIYLFIWFTKKFWLTIKHCYHFFQFMKIRTNNIKINYGLCSTTWKGIKTTILNPARMIYITIWRYIAIIFNYIHLENQWNDYHLLLEFTFMW